MIIASLLALYALFLLYVLTMSFKRAWPSMGIVAKACAVPVVVVGVVLDWLVNMLIGTVMFMDPPSAIGELLTGRLQRMRRDENALSWRYRLATYICQGLNNFDPSGEHC